MRHGAALLAVLCILTLDAGNAGAGGAGARADDVQLLAQRLVSYHPNLFHDLSRVQFEAKVADATARADTIDDDELIVELMKIAAMPGVRDGHTGIFPFDPEHVRVLHAFPIRPYEFADGTYVIGPNGSDLVGAKLVAIDGVPLERVQAAVRPLVPHDNDASLSAREPQYDVTAEVLHGLGLIRAVGPVDFTFERSGVPSHVVLAPLTGAEYTRQIGDLARPLSPPPSRAPPYLERQRADLWTTLLSARRVWYVGYNLTIGDTNDVARKLLKVATKTKVRGVVVDLRNNPGGDNHTYVPLLRTLQRLSRTKRIVVLISRTTFSAAQNFATELERTARARFVGEPSGGSPNLYGDATPVALPASGLEVHIATIYWQKSTASDARLTIQPQVDVPLTSSEYFAGRDPQLTAAVRLALSR